MKRYKLVVYVPEEQADLVRNAIGDAGGGKIGNYAHCSFSQRGIGRFLPLQGSNPYKGQLGRIEQVQEERIEITVEEIVLQDVINSMKSVHPCEEVAYDVYPLLGDS